MQRRELALRIAARKRLLDLAVTAARKHGPERVETMIWQAQPQLAELLGEREIGAIVEIVSSPLGYPS
ncbi:MAG: hypothetical protein M3Y87_14340 [Myxococcota bacterium]|nr:hypothetical protein [Myxococcota bacterium]